MPHITIEYTANIKGELSVRDLLAKLHEDVAAHDIGAHKIMSRAVALDDYIAGDSDTVTSMVHVTCLLLQGRPPPFSQNLSKSLYEVLQDHVANQAIEKCALTLELREMNADTYCR